MNKKNQEKLEEKDEEELLELVRGDPGRIPYEKETHFLFNRQEAFIHVHSFDPTIVKDLIRHNYFSVSKYSTTEDGEIIGISGRLPTGVLKIKRKPRKQDYPSKIVSNYRDKN